MADIVFNVQSGKRIFCLHIDPDNITHRINRDRESDEYIIAYTEDRPTQEQIDADCNAMIAVVDRIVNEPDYRQHLVDVQPKKANGTFAKKRYSVLFDSTNMSQLWEDSYCYADEAIRIQATTDLDVYVTYEVERHNL